MMATNNMANVTQPQLHISSNPDDSMEELFKVVQSPQPHHHGHGSPHPQGIVPMVQRKLPPSFFRPPSACSSATHSRESSLDATFSPKPNGTSGKPPTPMSAVCNSPLSPSSPQNIPINQQQLLATKTTPPPPTSGLVYNHARARSLPATLQQSAFSLPKSNNNIQLQQPQPQQQQLQPQLPTQQQKQTQQQLQSPQLKAFQQQNFHARQHSYDINKIQFPEGWSVSYTENGDRYFLNHKDKTTTWEDPRKELLRRELQNTNSNSLAQIAAQQQIRQVPNTYSSQPNMMAQLLAQSQQQQQQQQQVPQFTETARFDPDSLPLPDGCEQMLTPNGDLYYVNHNERTTSWFHPSVSRQQQLKKVQLKQASSGVTPPSFAYVMQQVALAARVTTPTNGNNHIPPELVAALENMNTSGHTNEPKHQQSQPQQPQQQANLNPMQSSHVLNELEQERERMRQRAEEILQSNVLKTNYLPFNNQNSDPFLSSTADLHGRQESIDSGLSLASGSSVTGLNGSQLTLNTCATMGGVGTTGFAHADQLLSHNQNGNGMNFTSPDELLNSMDHQMVATQQQQQQQNRLNNHNPHGQQSQPQHGQNHVDDLSFIDNIDPSNFDMDFLTDVEELLNTNRDNIMTWL